MVNVVPGFTPLEENTAAGLARLGSNGIAAFAGDNLLTFQNGLDVIASVIAHEIGHKLGLDHTATGGANLMSPNGSTEQLTSEQITNLFRSTTFAKPLPVVALPGDYDGDGFVDATDYTVWRNSMNQTGASLPADGNKNGRIDTGDYAIWKTNFGRTSGAGSVALSPTTSAPEPATLLIALVAAAIVSMQIRQRK
jgi:hypothetical protein